MYKITKPIQRGLRFEYKFVFLISYQPVVEKD